MPQVSDAANLPSPSARRIHAQVDLSAILSNLSALLARAGTPLAIPMIKADAYGHGAIPVGAALARHAGPKLYGLGVATLEEGAELRAVIPNALSILVFSGAGYWTADKADYCRKHALTPVIVSWEDFESFLSRGDAATLAYELKFDTGMNRLGLPWDRAPEALARIAKLPVSQRPQGIASHLATAENPAHRTTRLQLKRIQALRALFQGVEGIRSFHFANSCAIANAKALEVPGLSNVVRPGLSLYGIPPWEKARVPNLRSALTLRAQVIRRFRLARGEATGYGSDFTNRSKTSIELATLGAGYGDGLHRSLSPEGFAVFKKRKFPFIGRISMDLSMLRCSRSLSVGDWVQLLGPGIDPWQQAKNAQTVPYELLTSLGSRVLKTHA